MKTDTNEESIENSIYSGTMPVSEQELLQGNDDTGANEELINNERKKYHSSAMYAASKWHNTVSHVKANSHKAQDM